MACEPMTTAEERGSSRKDVRGWSRHMSAGGRQRRDRATTGNDRARRDRATARPGNDETSRWTGIDEIRRSGDVPLVCTEP